MLFRGVSMVLRTSRVIRTTRVYSTEFKSNASGSKLNNVADCFTDVEKVRINKYINDTIDTINKKIKVLEKENELMLEAIKMKKVKDIVKGIPSYFSTETKNAVVKMALANEEFLSQYPEYDFSKVYDPMCAEALTILHTAIQSIPGAENHIKTIDHINAHDYYFEKIFSHPLVEEHYGAGDSFFCVNIWYLKYFYNKGWVQAVKEILEKRKAKN